MSVYCFGKLVGPIDALKQSITSLAQASDIEVRFGTLESEDEKMLIESAPLRAEGILFNIFTPNDSDIVLLYNEATNEGRRAFVEVLGEASLPYSWEQARTLVLPDHVLDAIVHSRLGRFLKGLFDLQEVSAGGLALFDNGVEQIIEETSTNCLLLILRSLIVSWDLGPSALFVWH